MKNIEDINRESVKKILASKKYPQFFPGNIVKLELELPKVKEKESNILKEFVLQKKIEI